MTGTWGQQLLILLSGTKEILRNLSKCLTLKENNFGHIERSSLECRKTKTKVITLANHKRHRQYSEPIKTRNYDT